MGKVAAHTTRIWFDEFQLSSALSSFTNAVEQGVIDTNSFEDAGPRRVVDNYDFNTDISGFFDGVATEIDETLDAAFRDGADHYLAIFPGASATGSWGREGTYKSSGGARSGAVAGAVLLESSHQGAGTLVRANLLENSSKSAPGDGTGRSIGITISPEVTVVTARIISGTFSALDFDIQDSDDDGTDPWANLAGLGFTLSAAGVTRKQITITTKLWKRVKITTFTGGSALLVVTIGNATA